LKTKFFNTKNTWNLIPIFGTLQFFFFYFIATLYYPGGSNVDINAISFSWANNYWCNLLSETAINGQPNAAKPFAMFGMFVLCITISIFWYIFPKQININKKLKKIIQIFGILGMVAGAFIFTKINHDFLTNLASLFLGIAFIGSIIGMYKSISYNLFAFGMLNILLVGLSNICYYNQNLIVYLPIIQKITFLSFLLWVSCICLKLYREKK
jgi:hypothetical protein